MNAAHEALRYAALPRIFQPGGDRLHVRMAFQIFGERDVGSRREDQVEHLVDDAKDVVGAVLRLADYLHVFHPDPSDGLLMVPTSEPAIPPPNTFSAFY